MIPVQSVMVASIVMLALILVFLVAAVVALRPTEAQYAQERQDIIRREAERRLAVEREMERLRAQERGDT